MQPLIFALTFALAPPAGLPAAAALPPADTAAIRQAVVEVRAGIAHSAASRPAEAAAAYARAAARVPAFTPWSHVLAAAAAARTGDTAAVRTHLARGDTALAREWGWRARVDGMANAGMPLTAARLAEEAASRIDDPGRRAPAWARAGALYAQASRPGDARAALRRAIDAGSGTTGAVEAARTLSTLAETPAEDHLRIGRVYLRHGNTDRAAAALDAYVAVARPAAEQRAALQGEVGTALFNARDYAAAERRLAAVQSAAGSSAALRATGGDALHLLGRSQYRRGRTSDARATFTRVTREFAGTAAAARAHFVLADIEHDAGRIEAARTHYRAVLNANGPDMALAAVRLGSLALLENRPRDAAAMYAGVYGRVQTPADRQQTGFWWARSLEQAGARDSARLVLAQVRAIDPFSYYGLRAAELTGAALNEYPAPQAAATGTTAATRAAVVAAVDALDVLRQAGLEEAATFETARLAARYGSLDGALYDLGRAYHDRGQTFNGVRTGRELLRREGAWNRHILELVYPFPYRAAVLAAARAHQLDPFLVAGLIRQESMFNTQARSSAGALGLMQVMPATGTRVARTLGIPGFQPAQLHEPSINLRIGTLYLADQIRSHRNRLVDAIAAYNAGPTRVHAWRAFPEYADPELFTERIPFQETRDYVRIVQQNARIYRLLYGE